MLKLDNPLVKVIAFSMTVAFSFTSVAVAGDGQLLKSMSTLDDDKKDTAPVMAETKDAETEEQSIELALPNINKAPATLGLIVPVSISPQEIENLSQSDEQCSSYTKTNKAGEADAGTVMLAIAAIVATAVVLYAYISLIEVD